MLKFLLLAAASLQCAEITFDQLRQKWHEVPIRHFRVDSIDLLKESDAVLLHYYTLSQREGWHHDYYTEIFKGKKILDVGCGFGMESIYFAAQGAKVTCLDIVESNIELVKRMAQLLHVDGIEFFYMKDISSLAELPYDFDAMLCLGSLIHAPFETIRLETQELVKHLKPKGRWIELCYSKGRWEREGRLPFERWGAKTDGENTPWAEWYDLEKMKTRFESIKFNTLLYMEIFNGDFTWFDFEIE